MTWEEVDASPVAVTLTVEQWAAVVAALLDPAKLAGPGNLWALCSESIQAQMMAYLDRLELNQ